MSSIVWTPTAVQDLQRHRDYLATVSPEAANRAIQAIVKTGESLAQTPKRGRVVNAENGLRKLPVSFGKAGFVVHYILILDEVVILRVYHGREQRPS